MGPGRLPLLEAPLTHGACFECLLSSWPTSFACTSQSKTVPNVMNSNSVDELIAKIEEAQCCNFCGMHWFSQSEGEPCLCCGKSLLGRKLRLSTCDPSRMFYSEPNGDDVLYDTTSRLNIDGVLTPTPFIPRFAVRKPTFKRKKAKAAVYLTTKCGKQADDVLAEFEELLKRDGFKVGGGSDGTVRKYARYMKMLLDHDVFTCRADFFKPDSREKAHAFYRRMALEKASENGGTTSAGKLFGNFKNGFDKFVMLAHFESEFKPVEAPVCGSSDALPESHDSEEDALMTELLSYFA